MAIDILTEVKAAGSRLINCNKEGNSCTNAGTSFEFNIAVSPDTISCAPDASAIEIVVSLVNTSTGDVVINSTTTHADTPLPIEIAHTETLSDPGLYQLSISVDVCSGDESDTYDLQFQVCPDIDVERTACRKYTVTNEGSGSVTGTVSHVDGTEIVSETTLASGGSNSFTLPEDGIYLIEFTTSSGDTDKVYTYVLYEFCDLENCVVKSVQKILCDDEEDPCCNKCDEDAIAERRLFRHELNKIIAVYGYYLGKVFADQISYLGVFTSDASRAAKLSELDTMMDKITTITQRCGSVDCGNSITDGTNDCGTC